MSERKFEVCIHGTAKNLNLGRLQKMIHKGHTGKEEENYRKVSNPLSLYHETAAVDQSSVPDTVTHTGRRLTS